MVPGSKIRKNPPGFACFGPSFLGDEYEKKTKIGDNDALGKWFKEKRLKEIAGFKFVPEPILMKNAVGGQLYFLFFASHNETGKRIVNQIFDKYRKKLS